MMVKIVKAPVIKRGNVMTITQNLGKGPTTNKLPMRPQPAKKKPL